MTDQLSLLPMLNELPEGNEGTFEALQESVRQNRKGDKVMKFHGGNQLLQKHSGWFTIFELWIGRRVVYLNFYPQHLFHFLCRTNGAVKGKDNCLDVSLHILGFFFGYTDYGYSRYKKEESK